MYIYLSIRLRVRAAFLPAVPPISSIIAYSFEENEFFETNVRTKCRRETTHRRFGVGASSRKSANGSTKERISTLRYDRCVDRKMNGQRRGVRSRGYSKRKISREKDDTLHFVHVETIFVSVCLFRFDTPMVYSTRGDARRRETTRLTFEEYFHGGSLRSIGTFIFDSDVSGRDASKVGARPTIFFVPLCPKRDRTRNRDTRDERQQTREAGTRVVPFERKNSLLLFRASFPLFICRVAGVGSFVGDRVSKYVHA